MLKKSIISILLVIILIGGFTFFNKTTFCGVSSKSTELSNISRQLVLKLIEINKTENSEYFSTNSLIFLLENNKEYILSSNMSYLFNINLPTIKLNNPKEPILFTNNNEEEFIGIATYADGHTRIFNSESSFISFINEHSIKVSKELKKGTI